MANFRYYSGHTMPCINVKIPALNLGGVFSERVAAKFGCSKETAEKALGFAFESAAEQFWFDIQDTAREILGDSGITISQEGRSGGWLAVRGLPDADGWNDALETKFVQLEQSVEEEMKYLLSDEHIFEAIESNEWYKDGSEEYNFIDVGDGKRVNVADLNQHLAAERTKYIAEHAK